MIIACVKRLQYYIRSYSLLCHLFTHLILGLYIGSSVQKQADDLYIPSRWSHMKRSVSKLKNKHNSMSITITSIREWSLHSCCDRKIIPTHTHSSLTHRCLSMYIGSSVQKEADDFYMPPRWSPVKRSGSILTNKHIHKWNKINHGQTNTHDENNNNMNEDVNEYCMYNSSALYALILACSGPSHAIIYGRCIIHRIIWRNNVFNKYIFE